MSALAACLTGQARDATTPAAETAGIKAPRLGGPVSLTARTMTVTGLLCPALPIAGGVCRADSVSLDSLHLQYTGADHLCVVANRVTARGSVRLSAELLTGRLFGLLPVALSTRALPPIPFPYVRLADVHARGVSLDADDLRGERMTFRAGQGC
ncbi:hypothetical protein [Streptomyces sp. H27-D2]|uniref:hypothetical protein n=1 Tax=Streptomyces sp. H27-D2 TaxID=3046304 RepID=UPI002DBB3FB5|nr:hypothetical protein [Streptomyces sp. H27-D2]MEC4016286.1 hypothetical protein [Streptomyces sp. H27-D2]